jgi:protein-L-isoaspartate(D-aspartate) O-methyltransferase
MMQFLFSSDSKPDSAADKFAHEREDMVRWHLEARGIKDPRVLDAFRKVPRHEFVPRSFERDAYSDHPLPISEGQTISQPYMVAIMTELLTLTGNEKILEIGTGSGYQAAILSLLAKKVYSIEIVEPLAKKAAELLRRHGYDNVHVRSGDGYAGLPEHAPFDAIIITCAPPYLPEPLQGQLAEGGKIIVPLGAEGQMQMLTVYEKKEGKIVKKEEGGCFFVPMTGKIEKEEKDE